MSRSIGQFFPVYENKTRRVQANIPQSIIEQADRIRKNKKLTWGEVMTGLLQKMVEDLGSSSSPTQGFKLKQMDLLPREDASAQAKFGCRR